MINDEGTEVSQLTDRIQRFMKTKDGNELDRKQAQGYLVQQLFVLRPEEEQQNKDQDELMNYIGCLGPRKFQVNDIVWGCKQCQRDETCVICNECYQASDHEGHDVYFYHSTMGGCCDCGDCDAWKSSGFCSKHGHSTADPVSYIPRDITKVASVIFDEISKSLLAYITYTASLYDLNKPREQRDELSTVVLCYDEYHSDEDYSVLFKRLGEETPVTTFIAAGSLQLKTGNFEECRVVTDEINKKGFNVYVGYLSDAAIETRTIASVVYLHELALRSDGMCRIISASLGIETLSDLLENNYHLSKTLRDVMSNLLLILSSGRDSADVSVNNDTPNTVTTSTTNSTNTTQSSRRARFENRNKRNSLGAFGSQVLSLSQIYDTETVEEEEPVSWASPGASTEGLAKLRAKQRQAVQDAWQKAVNLLNAAREAEYNAEKATSEIERIAASIESNTRDAESATTSAKTAADTLDGELAAMEEFKSRADAVSAKAHGALLATSLAANLLNELHVTSSAEITAADNALDEELTSIQAGMKELDERMAEAETKWTTDRPSKAERAAQRAVFAQQSAEIMQHIYESSQRREDTAVTHVQSVQRLTDEADVQQKASVTAEAAATAQHLRDNFRSTEVAISVAQSSNVEAEKVNAAAMQVAEAHIEFKLAVLTAQRATEEAATTAEAAQVAIAAYEELGKRMPEHNTHSAEGVEQRAARNAEATQRVSMCAETISTLQTAVQSASQHAATKCGQSVAARAVGYIALARASEAGQEAAQTATKAIELQSRTLTNAEDALNRCKAETLSSLQAWEDARTAAVDAENLRLAQEQAEIARREREAAEFLLAEQRAAHGKAKLLLEAAKAAEISAEELTNFATRIENALEKTLLTAQEAASSVDLANLTTSLALGDMGRYVADAVALNNATNETLFRTALLATVAQQEHGESAVFIKETDALFASEHKQIENDAIQLDCALAEAEDRWHTEDWSAVARAAERLPMAVQGAQLMQLMHQAAMRKTEKLGENLSRAQARSQASDTHTMTAAAAKAGSEASAVLQKCHSSSATVSSAAQAAQDAAQKSKHAAEAAAEAKARVLLTMENAAKEAVKCAELVAAAAVALEECEKVGAERPALSVNATEDVVRRNNLQLEARRKVLEVVEEVFRLNESTQSESLLVVSTVEKSNTVRTEVEVNIAHVTESCGKIHSEAATATDAHNSTISNAEAAMARAKFDVRSSKQAVEESLFAVADAESALFEEQTAHELKLQAEHRAKQQAAQKHAQITFNAAKSAELTIEKAVTELERQALSLDASILSAQEAVSNVRSSRVVVEEALVACETYCQRAEELSNTTENALLTATLEANVAQENSDAYAERVRAADAKLSVQRTEVEASLQLIETQAQEDEALWEASNTPETIRAAQRVAVTQQRAALRSKLFMAVVRRREQAAEHVTQAQTHTEATDAKNEAVTASSSATTAETLKADVWASAGMSQAGQVSFQSEETSSIAAHRALQARQELRKAEEAAQKADLVYIQAEAAAQSARESCDALQAEVPPVDPDSTVRAANRSQRTANSIRRVHQAADQIASLHEQVKAGTVETTVQWGKAVAARAVGDMAVTHIVECAHLATEQSSRASSVHTNTINFVQNALTCCNDDEKAASADIVAARTATALADAALTAALDAEEAREIAAAREAERLEAERLRAEQQTARNKALEALAATKAAEFQAEELSFEVERIALSLEHTVLATEEALASSHKLVGAMDAELTAMTEFVDQSTRHIRTVESSLSSASMLTDFCAELSRGSVERINQADEVYAAERRTFEREAIHLHDAREGYEVQWERDNVPHTQRAAHRVALALENAGLMLELFDAAVSRQHKAVEHVTLARSYTEPNEAQEQAAAATTAATEACALQARARSLEHARGIVKSSKLAAERVHMTVATGAEVQMDIQTRVKSVATAETAVAASATFTRECIEACASVGADAPEFNVNKADSVKHRQTRCLDAQRRVEACLVRLTLLKTTTDEECHTITTQFDVVAAARTQAEANVTQVNNTAEQVRKQASVASATEAEMIQFAEDALARCRVEAAACGEMEEKSRVAAEEANSAKVVAEQTEVERAATLAAEQARILAETIAAKKLAAQNRVTELSEALRVAALEAEELSHRPASLMVGLDEMLHLAEQEEAATRAVIAPAHDDYTGVEEFRVRTEDIKATAENALLAATMEASVVESSSQALYQRIAEADGAFYAERTSIDAELRAFDTGVDDTEHMWECQQNVPENHKLTKRAGYARDREGLVTKKLAVVSRREELAMEHVVVAGGITEVREAEAMALIAQNAAVAASKLQKHTEFLNQAANSAELSGQAASRVRTQALEATKIRDSVKAAAEEAAAADLRTVKASADLNLAIAECEKIGAEVPAVIATDADSTGQREQRHLSAVLQAEETVERIQELDESAQRSFQRAKALAEETTTSTASGVQYVVLTEEASQQATQQANRARAVEVQLIADAEAALARARSESKPARQAVIDARIISTEAERLRLDADELDAQKVAADMLRTARSAADLRVEKQRAAVAKAKVLVEAAEAAERVAEERTVNVEKIARSLTSTHEMLVEASVQASSPGPAARKTLTEMNEYKTQAESLFNTADQARLMATAKATACEENRVQSQSRIQRSDETLLAERTKLTDELAKFELSVTAAEQQWEEERAPEVVRTSQRTVLAKDKARLVSQISAAAAKRAVLASQHVALLQARHEVEAAQEKAQVATNAAAQATELQSSLSSVDHLQSATETSTETAARAATATQAAIEAEAGFRAAMLEATKANKAAIQASSAAKSAILACEAVGAEGPKYTVPSPDALTRRTQRCTEATAQVHDQDDIIKVLNMSIQKSAVQIETQYSQIVSAKEEGDSFVSQTLAAAADATAQAARANEIEQNMLTEAEAAMAQARAEAKVASEEGKAAHLAAVLAAQAHTNAVEAGTASGTVVPDLPPTQSEVPLTTRTAGYSTTHTSAVTTTVFTSNVTVEFEQDLVLAAQKAITTADEMALKAERGAFSLEHTILAVEDALMTAKGAVGVVHGEFVYMEAYRTDAEKLSTTAQNASLAAALEANVSEEHNQASAERIKIADEALTAARATYDAALRVLSEHVATAEAQWEKEGTSETDRATQKASFARELADLLNKLSIAVSFREQKASDHLNVVKSHTEAVDAQKKANVAATAATSATNLFHETRSTDQASRVSLTGCRAADKTPELCKQATEAREEVRLAVAKSLKAAELFEQIARKAEGDSEFPSYDLQRRAQRCEEAVKRVDESAATIVSLSEAVRQSAQLATTECGQSVAARAVGDMAVKQAQEYSKEATGSAATAASTASAMLAAAESALSWARIQAKSTSDEAQAAEREAVALQSSIARVTMSRQDAALSTVNELLSTARAAALLADEKIVEVERIASTLEPVVFSAEEASMMSKGAVGVVHGELMYMEAYKKVAEDIATQAEQELPANSPKARSSEQYETSAMLIRSADESYAAEKAALEKKIRGLADTTAAAELRWRAEEEPEVNRVNQRASFAQARSRFLEKLSVAAATREKVAEEHLAMAHAYSAQPLATESVSMKSTAASVASDLQSDTRTTENAVSASRAGLSASERAKTAANTAEQIEKDILLAADAAKTAVEKYLIAEKAAKAAIAKYAESGVSVPAYEKGLTEEVCLRTERRIQAVKRVTESADYVLMLQDSAQLSYQQAASQCADAVQARARGDRAVARVVNPATAADLEMVSLAEEALARCKAESRATLEAFNDAKLIATELRKTKVGLHSIASRSNLGMFLKQEFGETESHLVTGAVSLSPFKDSPVVMSRKSISGPSDTDDPNAGSNVDHTYVQSPTKAEGKHEAVIPEIWSLQGEALAKYRATQEAERIRLAHQSAPIEETKMYEAKRLESKKQSFRIKELRKQQLATEEDLLAQDLENNIELISTQVEQALFAAEQDVAVIEDTGVALRGQLTWMEEFKTNATGLNNATEDTLQNAKLYLGVARDNNEQSARRIQQADHIYFSERHVLEASIQAIEHDFSGVQRESLVSKLYNATDKRVHRAAEHVVMMRALTEASAAREQADAAHSNSAYAEQMRAWYTSEHLHGAHTVCDDAMQRVTLAKSTIEAQINQAEAMITAILAMCSITAANKPKSSQKENPKRKSNHNISTSSIRSENTISSLSDADYEDLEDEATTNSRVARNATDTQRVLQLALERMRIAGTRANKLHENATQAFTLAESAHHSANTLLEEAVASSNMTIQTAQQALNIEAETIHAVESASGQIKAVLFEVSEQLTQARSELASASMDSHHSHASHDTFNSHRSQQFVPFAAPESPRGPSLPVPVHMHTVPANSETKDSSEDGKESDSDRDSDHEEENEEVQHVPPLRRGFDEEEKQGVRDVPDPRAQPHTPLRGAHGSGGVSSGVEQESPDDEKSSVRSASHSVYSAHSVHSAHSAHSAHSHHSNHSTHSHHSAHSGHSLHSLRSAHSAHSVHSVHSVHSGNGTQHSVADSTEPRTDTDSYYTTHTTSNTTSHTPSNTPGKLKKRTSIVSNVLGVFSGRKDKNGKNGNAGTPLSTPVKVGRGGGGSTPATTPVRK